MKRKVRKVRKIKKPMILAIDPGAGDQKLGDCSGWVLLDPTPGTVLDYGNQTSNDELMEILKTISEDLPPNAILVVETFRPQGQPLYWQLIWTAIWTGRFIEAWGRKWDFLHRQTVKHHITGMTNAKDSNVNAALLDRWGGKEIAKGRKKDPGPLYGLAKHAWPALALAVAYAEGARSTAPNKPRRKKVKRAQ
jgi:hypothetical protein